MAPNPKTILHFLNISSLFLLLALCMLIYLSFDSITTEGQIGKIYVKETYITLKGVGKYLPIILVALLCSYPFARKWIKKKNRIDH